MRLRLALALFLLPAVAHGQPQPLAVDSLFRFKRIADPQVSPDGKWVAFVQGEVDLDKNRITRNLWLASTDPAQPTVRRRLTATDKGDGHPRWSPDGKAILFESNRSGSSQLWIIDVDGGEARQLTTISTGASGGIWSRDGKRIAFVSAVWPEFSEKPFAESDAANKKRMDDAEKDPVKAKVFTKLFFRHWDSYVEDKRQHLFVVDYAHGKAGEPRDVTPGDRDAQPTSSTFSLGDDYMFSPNGEFLYFTAVPAKDEAWSTDHDVCYVPVAGSKNWTVVSKNPAADASPKFSPDGRWLAYRAQKKPGYEADQWKLMLVAMDGAATPMCLTDRFRGSVDAFEWTADSRAILFSADENGAVGLFEARVDDPGDAKLVSYSAHSTSAVTQSRDGRVTAFSRVAMHHPPEVFVRVGDEAPRNVSQANASLIETLSLPRPESVTIPGDGDVPMQMWILKPPGFDASKKWPLVYLVHGGPQSAWEDAWSYRWNPQIWAAQGYVVAMPNPRGSTGFGQKYVDEISGDWGGKCYRDLMAGLAHLEKQPWIDADRMASAGASFGGYMMNWFAVNTGKFKTLINHCGVWNFDSMYSTTEELWFDEWEHGGPPWGGNRASYEKHSPHRLAANLAKFKTPMLVIHNDLDFRVPVSEAIQLFTTMQRLGVPSRFVNFPDEGHWVLRPRNSQRWHNEVFAWLKKHVAPGGR